MRAGFVRRCTKYDLRWQRLLVSSRSTLGVLDPLTSSRPAPIGTMRLTAWLFVAGLAAQGVFGWLLAEDDFGVFAIAIGIGSLVYALRDGGVRRYLVERGPYASPNVRANALWYSLGVSALAALALALLAPVGGWLFDEGSIRSLLLIAAASVPLGFFAPIARALLHSHDRVGAAEVLDGVAVVVHYGLAALFAALDLGAASLVLPFLFTSPALSFVGWVTVRRMAIPFGRASSRGVLRIGRRSYPALVDTAATGLLRHGQFAALGLAGSIEVVGFYYFAYRLVMGSVLWLTAPVRWFLVPAFASMHSDRWRRRRAALDSFLVGSLVIGTVPLLLAALARPVEVLVWRGRWEEAVFPIQVLGVVTAFEVVVVVALMLLESSGALRLRVGVMTWRGLGLVGVMALAGWLASSLDVIATAAGLYLIISGAVVLIYVLELLDLDWVKVGRAVGGVYLLTGGATALALLTRAALDGTFSWLQLGAAGGVFVAVVLIGSRTFFESRLRRVATVVERTTGNTLLQKTLRRSRSAESDAAA